MSLCSSVIAPKYRSSIEVSGRLKSKARFSLFCRCSYSIKIIGDVAGAKAILAVDSFCSCAFSSSLGDRSLLSYYYENKNCRFLIFGVSSGSTPPNSVISISSELRLE